MPTSLRTKMKDSNSIISRAYAEYYSDVLRFMEYKVGVGNDAEDLTQDVFVKLLCYDSELLWASIRNLIYKISSNLVNDYWRRHYVRSEADRYLMEMQPVSGNLTEETVIGNELALEERKCLARMARKRRLIYERRRFFGESAQEIADNLNISRRTVENHLQLGYKEMRSHIRACC